MLIMRPLNLKKEEEEKVTLFNHQHLISNIHKASQGNYDAQLVIPADPVNRLLNWSGFLG